MKRTDDKDVRTVHAAMTRELGRPPTLHELALRLGTTQHMIRCFVLDDNLPLSRLTPAERAKIGKARREERARREEAERAERAKRERSTMRIWQVEPVRMEDIPPTYLPRSGEALPGKDAEMSAVIIARCAKCARRIVVRPRSHPWWRARDEGMMSPLCSASCAGIVPHTVCKINV